MTPSDGKDFRDLLQGVHDFYGRELSPFAADVWWQALRQYDLPAIREAFSRHCVNPDTGQFMPKPADVVKMIGGSTQDSALLAWSKVDRAVRSVGTHRSVVFDDPVIHAVLSEMGGWIPLGIKADDEWPFIRNEFVTRYRGYKLRSVTPEHPPVLIGSAEAHNATEGQRIAPPVLLGNPDAARAVLAGGSAQPLLAVTPIAIAGDVAA